MSLGKLPHFASEAEEADWVYEHRDDIADDLVAAMRDGRLGENSRAQWERRKQQETASSSQSSSTPGTSVA
jgi:hypothetical protein